MAERKTKAERVPAAPTPPKARPHPSVNPTETPRRERTVAGKRYVLINGGWRRAREND